MERTILLCEDSPFFAQAIATVLKTQGYNVITAGDGVKGLEVLNTPNQIIDLILCDIMMPNLDGYGVLKGIQSDPNLAGKNIPFIFLTGVSDMDSIDRAKNLGAKDYFIKSNVGMDKIIELVKKYL